MSDPKRYVIGVYNVGLRYGGPEEGGWWYDAGKLVRVMRVVRTEEQAYAYAARLDRRLAATLNKGLPPKSASNSRDWFEAHIFPDNAPSGFPDRKPHYE